MTRKTSAKQQKKTSIIKMEVSTEEAANLIGLTPERVRQLSKAGWIKRLGLNRFRVVDVVQGVLAFREKQAAAAAQPDELVKAKIESIALRNAELARAGEARAAEAAIAVVDEFAGSLRSDLMAIPARVTPDIALRRRIEDQIDEAFGAAGKRAAAAAVAAPSTAPKRSATRR